MLLLVMLRTFRFLNQTELMIINIRTELNTKEFGLNIEPKKMKIVSNLSKNYKKNQKYLNK